MTAGWETIAIPELNGSSGAVRIVLLGAPVLRSRTTGEWRPIDEVKVDDGEGGWEMLSPGFFLHIQIVFGCGSYVMKLKEYLPRLIYQCRWCQHRIEEEPGSPHQFELAVEPLELAPFRVEITAPAVACPGCGRHNILWSDSLSAEIEAAADAAFRSIP